MVTDGLDGLDPKDAITEAEIEIEAARLLPDDELQALHDHQAELEADALTLLRRCAEVTPGAYELLQYFDDDGVLVEDLPTAIEELLVAAAYVVDRISDETWQWNRALYDDISKPEFRGLDGDWPEYRVRP